MSPYRQVEETDTITAEGVSPALEHDSLRLEPLHDTLHDWLKCQLIRCIINPIIHREVHCIVLTCFGADILQAACTREEVSIFVEGDSQDAISCQEGLLNTIAMMTIDVDIEYALVCLEELKNTKDAIIDVAKATRFKLLCVVKSSSPIHSDVRLALCEFSTSKECPSCVSLAILIHVVKHWAVTGRVSEAISPDLVSVSVLMLQRDVL